MNIKTRLDMIQEQIDKTVAKAKAPDTDGFEWGGLVEDVLELEHDKGVLKEAMNKIKVTKKGKLSIALSSSEYLQVIQVFQLMQFDIEKPFSSIDSLCDTVCYHILKDFYMKRYSSFLTISGSNTLQFSPAEALAFFYAFNNKQEVHSNLPAVSALLAGIHQKLS